MNVHTIPVLEDNYAHIIHCPETNKIGLIDTPDAGAILSFLKDHDLNVDVILNTHHHWDHMGGNLEILKEFPVDVYASHYDAERVDGATKLVGAGDVVKVGNLEFKVMDVPGHTLGHIAYYGHGALFCGDTLFVGGCGRLFEGTPKQMWDSLNQIKTLPDDTTFYCAHEYTESNLEFALSVEPGNDKLVQKLKEVKELRANNQPTVPANLGAEKDFNPFLRWDSSEIKELLVSKGADAQMEPWQVFAGVRELKDNY